MINLKRNTTAFALFWLLLLTGCAQPTPVTIFVTPTPEEAPSEEATSVADLPTVQTQTPTDADVVSIPGATVTYIGPIVGQGYQPPTTNTPLPTSTPLVTATPLPTSPPPTEPPADQPPTARPAPTGTAIPALDASDVGIQSLSFLTNDDMNDVMNQIDANLQLDWVKFQIAWDFFQPNGPNEVTEDLRRLEIFIEQIRQQRQVNVLISFAKAPDWTRSNTNEDGPPDDPQALANFITLVLSETNNSIAAVEIWNEPNLSREWTGQEQTGANYMRYFDVSYQAIKAVDPNITVITAGLAPTGNSQFSRDDREFLLEMYAAGLANYDGVGVGVHPYGWGNPPDARCCDPSDERGWDDAPQFFFLNTLEDYRDIMVANGHTDAQLWPTEFGWATWEGLPGEPPEIWMTYNTKWDQANYTLRAIQIMQSLDYVGPMFLWNLNFAQPILIEQRDERIAYSIILPEGAPRERPLYWMLYDATRPDEQLERFD